MLIFNKLLVYFAHFKNVLKLIKEFAIPKVITPGYILKKKGKLRELYDFQF